MAFSPDGRTLAVAGGDGKVWLWNLANPARPTQLGQPLTGPGPVNSVAFSPTGRPSRPAARRGFGCGTSPPASLLASRTSVSPVAFGPDGHTLAVSSDDDHVWLWNAPIRPPQPAGAAS